MAEIHFPLTRLAAAVNADGVKCVIRAGAQGKSARNFATKGYYRGCQAMCNHHSVSSGLYPANDIAYIDGGKGEGWIISNAYTALDGTVTLIASGPTYTEGAGGPWGMIPQDRAVDVCFSNEIASWGAEDSVYPVAQQDAVLCLSYHVARIAADVWSWPDDPFSKWRSFSHFEWAPGRKIDPRGISRWSPQGGMWNMDAFRNDLRNYAAPEEDDDMTTLPKPTRVYDSRETGGPFALGESREVTIGMTTEATVGVTVIGRTDTNGFVSVNDPSGETSIIGWSTVDKIEGPTIAPVLTPNGRIVVTVHNGSADVAVDVWAKKP